MVQDNEHLFHSLDRALEVLNRHINLVRQVSPCLLNVINFINVQRAGVWTKLLPDFLVDLDPRPRLEIFHGAAEGVRVRGGGAIV